MKNNKGIKPGILQPMHKHRFVVLINDDVDLAQQVINCALDCHKQQFEILIRQSITANIMEKVNAICIGLGYSTIKVQALCPQNQKEFFYYEMKGAKVIHHEFLLDYADGDVATHNIKFQYQSLNVE